MRGLFIILIPKAALLYLLQPTSRNISDDKRTVPGFQKSRDILITPIDSDVQPNHCHILISPIDMSSRSGILPAPLTQVKLTTNMGGGAMSICPKCEGARLLTCNDCDGKGNMYFVPVLDIWESGCSECHGSGVVMCSECHGRGYHYNPSPNSDARVAVAASR